MENHPQHF